jgi:hypothetical protein
MNDDLVTLTSYWSPVEARLAMNRIEEAGIKVAIADEITATVNWDLTNAIRGIKLLVRREDFERAEAILFDGEELPAEEGISEYPEEPEEQKEAKPPQVPEMLSEESDPLEPILNERQKLIDRAYRVAIFGLILWPLQLGAAWLLWRIYLSDEPLGPEKRRTVLITVIINFVILFIFGYWILGMIYYWSN